MATPFVQGQLRKEPINTVVKTECAHCGRSIHIELDSAFRFKVNEPEADPMLFIPMVNFSKVEDASIINVF